MLLLGASGSMGFAAFKELWGRKNEHGERKYDIVLLLRPSAKNKEMFESYEKECGITTIPGKGVCENTEKSVKIVWGDATAYEDMLEAVRGVDPGPCPGRLLSISLWISSIESRIPGGHPSMTTPRPFPWDSPQVVILKRVPKEFPPMLSPSHALLQNGEDAIDHPVYIQCRCIDLDFRGFLIKGLPLGQDFV